MLQRRGSRAPNHGIERKWIDRNRLTKSCIATIPKESKTMNNLMYSSFPIHMLPEAFQDPLWEAVAQVQAPPEIIFSSMLVTAAVACQGMADVQRKDEVPPVLVPRVF